MTDGVGLRVEQLGRGLLHVVAEGGEEGEHPEVAGLGGAALFAAYPVPAQGEGLPQSAHGAPGKSDLVAQTGVFGEVEGFGGLPPDLFIGDLFEDLAGEDVALYVYPGKIHGCGGWGMNTYTPSMSGGSTG